MCVTVQFYHQSSAVSQGTGSLAEPVAAGKRGKLLESFCLKAFAHWFVVGFFCFVLFFVGFFVCLGFFFVVFVCFLLPQGCRFPPLWQLRVTASMVGNRDGFLLL